MRKRKATICLLFLLAMGLFAAASPTSVGAQATDPPPELIGEEDVSDADILVFEPQLFVEFPFTQGFAISFNFGIKFEVPRRLSLVNNDVLNFFLRFRSYIIPAGTATPTPTPTPTSTPTPLDMTPTPTLTPTP